ncbi:hypothetical protein J2X65_000795 [Ancylobacter sp. 3268]|nr:hypothetical protein [Ancylobacter sp. 3268]
MTVATVAWYVAPLILVAACYVLFLATRANGHHASPAE